MIGTFKKSRLVYLQMKAVKIEETREILLLYNAINI